MILIYTHNITPRLAYAMDLVFNTVLNVQVQLTDELQYFNTSSLPKFAYTQAKLDKGLFIRSSSLLFEEGIVREIPSASGTYLDFPIFFPTDFTSLLPYDIFATVFYFVTRYEEYINVDLDRHQRFKAESSLAFKHQFLNKPFLNYLIEDLGQKLKTSFPALEFKPRVFNFLSTIDIDNAFAYAHKGLKRNVGGFIKDVFTLQFTNTFNRIASNIKDKKDPYNTFDLINSMSKDTQTVLQYFVLLGDYSQFDKNPHYENKGFRTLLKSLSSEHTLGLHPSYESYTHQEKIDIEKKRLEEIIEKKITSARCHFLRVKFPETYRTFIKTGITDDYTMIYASQCGFRTGLCTPYKWFDLEKNEVTDLTIHPSTVMEGVLRDYNKLSSANANNIVTNLLNEVKKYNGEFVSIFHNDSFMKGQEQWVELYRKLLVNSKLILK
jgi:hypothetical protein